MDEDMHCVEKIKNIYKSMTYDVKFNQQQEGRVFFITN
jgi:hypothetical protein